MDRGAWQATVHGVTKSWTQVRLTNTHTYTHTHTHTHTYEIYIDFVSYIFYLYRENEM